MTGNSSLSGNNLIGGNLPKTKETKVTPQFAFNEASKTLLMARDFAEQTRDVEQLTVIGKIFIEMALNYDTHSSDYQPEDEKKSVIGFSSNVTEETDE